MLLHFSSLSARTARLRLILLALSILATVLVVPVPGRAEVDFTHQVAVGDTWSALAARYGVTEARLREANPHPNPGREPVIGSTIQLPPPISEHAGHFVRSNAGGLLHVAAKYGQNVWQLAAANELSHPYEPLLFRPLLVPAADVMPRELPVGFEALELSDVPAQPGWPIAFRGLASTELTATAAIDSLPLGVFTSGKRVVGIGGTGAFFSPGAPEFSIQPANAPLWAQPWPFSAGEWDYDRLTLTGEAADIDAEAIAAERARLNELWAQTTPQPLWQESFALPIEDYVQVSSNYGARRSYNGGPFRSYHEGVDFAAYGGTPVYAPATGAVVLAERLYVRGGAVIIDHGWGIYSGYYHLSNVIAEVGQTVMPGDLLGEVGTTGLSSGNHLHWDLVVGGVWIDASRWRERDMACWLLEAWGMPCQG